MDCNKIFLTRKTGNVFLKDIVKKMCSTYFNIFLLIEEKNM